MKKIMQLLKKKNNKGFSLVEILAAMTILALVTGPLCKALMASLDINSRARMRMSATDACQAVMEGFADKSYEEILASVDGILDGGATIPEAPNRLSLVDGGYYNIGDNALIPNTGGKTYPMSNVSNCNIQIDKYTADFYTGDFSAKECSHNAEEFPYLLNEFVWQNAVIRGLLQEVSGKPNKGLMVYAPSGDRFGLVLAFVGVENLNPNDTRTSNDTTYTFDVVVSLLPMANSNSDKYFPYEIYANVYNHCERLTELTMHLNGMENRFVMTMESGTTNK